MIFMGAAGRKRLCARTHITSAKPAVPYVRGANLRFLNRSAMARVLSLWRSIEKKGQKIVGYARTRSPDLWIHRAVLYQ